MTIIVEKTLVDVVRRYGREIVLDERRCEAVLKDLCGGDACRREVRLLMCAVSGGVVDQLLAGGNGAPKKVLEIRLTKRLRDEFGITDELAGWSVKSWMMALGMIDPSDDPKPQSQATPVLGHKVGDVDVVDLGGGEKLELGWCPPGNFMMGSLKDEVGRDDDEVQHRVTVTKGFWMGKYEVTQGQWERVIGDNPAFYKGPGNPVEQVSWDDCQVFIQKLNEVHGLTAKGSWFRLPTEEEWEYACRAGTTGAYAGNLDEMGWCFEKWNRGHHPVGQKKANDWGLYDMHGNVGEWCQDTYEDYLEENDEDATRHDLDSSHVYRGGSWAVDARYCRSAYRSSLVPGDRFLNLGLRLFRDAREQ